jgi:hypothetical protein
VTMPTRQKHRPKTAGVLPSRYPNEKVMETKPMEKPNLAPGQWFTVEGVNCVVCGVFTDSPWDAEVVFMDKGKSTNKDIKWDNDRWIFTGGAGGYAGDYQRLSEFVSILRRGRQYHLRE